MENNTLILPDHYAGELNTKRIKAYQLLHEQYNLEEGTVRDIFCRGADWYKEEAEKLNKKPTVKSLYSSFKEKLYELWYGHPFLLKEEADIIIKTRLDPNYKHFGESAIQALIKSRIRQMYKEYKKTK
jgi:hypothetical protein